MIFFTSVIGLSIIQFSFVLLANQYPEYPASAQDPVEGDNDRLTDELKGKIHKLKSVRFTRFVSCNQRSPLNILHIFHTSLFFS